MLENLLMNVEQLIRYRSDSVSNHVIFILFCLYIIFYSVLVSTQLIAITREVKVYLVAGNEIKISEIRKHFIILTSIHILFIIFIPVVLMPLSFIFWLKATYIASRQERLARDSLINLYVEESKKMKEDPDYFQKCKNDCKGCSCRKDKDEI